MDTYLRTKVDDLKKNQKLILLFTFVFVFFFFLGHFIPEGFDWRVSFGIGNIPTLWTPWVRYVVRPLSFPLLVAITLTSIVIRTYRYNPSPLPTLLACFSLPTVWVVFIGNLDGLVLLGLMLLPIGIPLVLLKPQIAAFSLLAKKSYVLAGAIWLVISILIWGPWPLNFLIVTTPNWAAEWTQDISLFPWGIFLAIPLLWLSRKDEDLLMLAGSFATPHLFPYHFLITMPALGRMKTQWVLIAWTLSWFPLLANWLGIWAWHFGNLFALVMWLGIYFSKQPVQHLQINLSLSNSQS